MINMKMIKKAIIFVLIFASLMIFLPACNGELMTITADRYSCVIGGEEHFYSDSEINALSYNENLSDNATPREKCDNNVAMLKLKSSLHPKYVFYEDNSVKIYAGSDTKEYGSATWEKNGDEYVLKMITEDDFSYSITLYKTNGNYYLKVSIVDGAEVRIYFK